MKKKSCKNRKIKSELKPLENELAVGSTQALGREFPVVMLDFPKEEGSSTFSNYAHSMEERGAYFDISKQCNNLFEIPDLCKLPPETQTERIKDYKDFLLSALLTMIVGNSNDRLLNQTIRSLLVRFLNFYFTDKDILWRYYQAIDAGFTSPEWQNIPTLKDFLAICIPENLGLKSAQGDIKRALQQIQLSLKLRLESRVGKAIASPSSFRTDAQLLVFALQNLSNDDDAAVSWRKSYGKK